MSEPPRVAAIDGLTHRYGGLVALDRVSLEIPAGQLVGLIGPDGVGKSSLLGILAGARKIQSGDVRVLDGDMRLQRHRSAVCSRVAYMPQGLGRNLYPDLSVRENIEFLRASSTRDERSATPASPSCCAAPASRSSRIGSRSSSPAACGRSSASAAR